MADGDRRRIPDRTGGRLGRHLHHDPRNRDYPARGVLFKDDAPIVTRTWWRRGVFDQGDTSSCSPHSAAGQLRTSPLRLVSPERASLPSYDSEAEILDLYAAAQKIDPWKDERHDGTTSDAPLKILRDRGVIREWRWCFGLDDVLRTLSHHGPVGVGVNWHDDMSDPDALGFVKPTGEIIGGHEFELLAVHTVGTYVTAVNSWSAKWGQHGRFRIHWDDLDALLKDDGDAVTIVV